MNAIELHDDFERFIATPKRLLKYIGLEMSARGNRALRWLFGFCILSYALFVAQFVHLVKVRTENLGERTLNIAYINYFVVTICKLLTFASRKDSLLRCFESFRRLFPSATTLRHHKLHGLLQHSLWLERLLVNFAMSITGYYSATPLVSAIIRCLQGQPFAYLLPYNFWYPFPLAKSIVVYVAVYALQVYVSFGVALGIVCCDLCLFVLLIQLRLHFELLARRIWAIDAAAEDAERRLKLQIKYHQSLLHLVEEVNEFFSFSVTCSLMSSSFILCSAGYQMLDDVSLLQIAKSFFLLCYELKQVVIACYYGEQLVEKSAHLLDAIYGHNWTDGSVRYQKLVLFAMQRMKQPSIITVARVSSLNLQTLQQVLKTSYQAFTVLKTT